MGHKSREEHFSIQKYKNPSGKVVWRVCGYDHNGKRIRKNFKTRAEALDQKIELEKEYEEGAGIRSLKSTSLSAEQLADAETALEGLGVRGFTKVVEHYNKMTSIAESRGVTLDVAMAFFSQNYRHETENVSLHTAIERFVASRKDGQREEATVNFYDSLLGSLLRAVPRKMVHEVTITDIERVIGQKKKLGTRRAYRRAFSVFFNWAIRHHHCLENPCQRLDKIPQEMSQIGILSLDEVRRLLSAAMQYQGGVMVAPIAIALFAGLRPSEINDLSEKDITGSVIKITGGKLRRTLNRQVPICAPLATWLKEYPFKGMPQGSIYKMGKLRDAVNAESWVNDILRHTSISFQLERDKDEPRVAMTNGTSPDMINRHYRNIIENPDDVVNYWKLTPKLIEKEGIEHKFYKIDLKEIDWPSPAKLNKLIKEKPVTHIAKDLGISDNAVRKHCKKLGIELPGRGY